MSWFVIFCYTWFAYGISVIFTQGVGPFGIFRRIRRFTSALNDNLGLLFRCMLCFPTNVGIVFSVADWFLIPCEVTPFNMVLDGTGLWLLAALMDGCFTGGVCHLLWNLDDFIDKNTPIYEDE